MLNVVNRYSVTTNRHPDRKLRRHIAQIIAQGYEEHHTATHREYISRRGGGVVYEYSGRYGTGYAVLTPRYDTTRYCYITYYIKD